MCGGPEYANPEVEKSGNTVILQYCQSYLALLTEYISNN